ncbi:MAG: radical SAM protein [Desulfobacterales bacterium]|nr:radical SAM protein [Desulfobacterales bacterium]
MIKEIYRTRGLCSECLEVTPAVVFQKGERIFMQKECPRHGRQEVLISSDAQWHRRMMRFSSRARARAREKTASGRGCPRDCGLCPEHEQRVYLPVAPITSACDLDCPVCYTINKNNNPYFMTREEFAAILDHIREDDPEMQIINFTGGEPLMHPDFREMVKMCRDAGVHRITVSTNGMRFLEDESLLPDLTRLGARIVFSFNSFHSRPYRVTAGRDLLKKKLEILALLEEYKPSTTLLAVVAAGVNDREIGEIVRHVLASDFIVSAEIHTVTFTGQNVGRFDPSTRLTTPDVIADIVEKNPNIEKKDFLPSPCAHPLCYAVCYLLRTGDGAMIPYTDFISEADVIRMLTGSLYMEPTLAMEEILTDVLNDIWSREAPGEKDALIFSTLKDLLRRMFPSRGVSPGGVHFESRQKIAESASRAIYIHSHMDAENFDASRVKYCCGAVPDGKGGNIPTCAYNTLYRAKDPRFYEKASDLK